MELGNHQIQFRQHGPGQFRTAKRHQCGSQHRRFAPKEIDTPKTVLHMSQERKPRRSIPWRISAAGCSRNSPPTAIQS